MPESYDWEIGKEASEAVSEIEEMGKENGLKVNTDHLQGHPPQEILDLAEKNNIDIYDCDGDTGKSRNRQVFARRGYGKGSKHAKAEVLVVRAPCS